MRRLLALLLTLALLLPCSALAAERFSYADAADARRKALEVFHICGFSSEYGNGGRNYLIRWEEPIRVCAVGSPSRTDLRQLDSFLTELSLRVPMLPPITRVDRESEAAIVLHYCRLREMPDLIPGYVSGNWGYFSIDYTGFAIRSGIICIAVDKCSQSARNHLMREELVGALGLCNDHDLYRDSILYQPWTTVQTLSEVDWIMLNMLYSPLVSPGDRWETVRDAIQRQYGL